MADPKHLTKLNNGVEIWNAWRTENPKVLTNLIGADLSEASLNKADLSRVNLVRADLSVAGFSEANLNEANLRGADLHEANLRDARLFETVFANTNLGDGQGLDACIHEGPSIIDHRTLAASGPLPLSFLRGCGLPDEFIEHLPSLLNQAIQFYSCFISYSTHDQAFAERLHVDLQNKNVRCWFAPHNIQGGKKIHEQIDEATRGYDRLLLILSEASMNSEWVETEIAKARKREMREHRRMLFPVRIVDLTEAKSIRQPPIRPCYRGGRIVIGGNVNSKSFGAPAG